MFVLQYIALPLLSVALAYLANCPKSKGTRVACMIGSVLLAGVQGLITWGRESAAEDDRANLIARIDDGKVENARMQEKVDEAKRDLEGVRADLAANRAELAATRTDLHATKAELSAANTNLSLQSRSIGSLVFNLGTSLEGKRRFVRCFQDLSRITSRREKPLVYEGLICKDGVAMFGFEQEPERLREFFFFTESEINYVLSGTPLGDRLVGADGKVSVDRQSELTLISQMMEKRLPGWSEDEIERERALAQIDDRTRVVLKYVYRSVGTALEWWRREGTGEIVSRRLAFSYAANPLADKLRILAAEIEMSLGEMKGYYGISVRDFNRRLIDRFYASGIEPKVRAKDVRGMNVRTLHSEEIGTFPYRK